MYNDFKENHSLKDEIFTTPQGRLVAWSQLLNIKQQVAKATSEDITLKQALSIVDDCFRKVTQ